MTTKTAHTPGPWQTTTDLHAGHYGPSWTIRLDKRVTVASVSGASLHLGAEACDANARLIAAAPELLAACKAALNFIHSLPYEPSNAPSTKAQDKLVDAIAKAEGR